MKFTEKELEILKREKMKEIDKWLDNEYGCSYTRLEELHEELGENFGKYMYEANIELLEKIREVREYIKKRTEFGEYTYAYPGVLNQDEVRQINKILDMENKDDISI